MNKNIIFHSMRLLFRGCIGCILKNDASWETTQLRESSERFFDIVRKEYDMFRRHWKKAASLIIVCVSIFLCCTGCTSKNDTSQETAQLREAVQNNYEESYVKETGAFRQILNDIVSFDPSDDLGYLRGNISGWLRSQTGDISMKLYRQCFAEDGDADAAISEALVKKTSELYESYARYIICLNDLTEDSMGALLKDTEFVSTNGELQTIIIDSLMRKVSSISEEEEAQYIKQAELAEKLLNQLIAACDAKTNRP